VPVRFILFALIGFWGLGVHLAVLSFGLKIAAVSFSAAQATATGVAMIANYTLNNGFTSWWIAGIAGAPMSSV
jgi:dolichol-phosphate mannosyltransferase